MALDLSRFAKAFFEEAQEHVSSLETLLVSVNLRAPDAETLNAIFVRYIRSKGVQPRLVTKHSPSLPTISKRFLIGCANVNCS